MIVSHHHLLELFCVLFEASGNQNLNLKLGSQKGTNSKLETYKRTPVTSGKFRHRATLCFHFLRINIYDAISRRRTRKFVFHSKTVHIKVCEIFPTEMWKEIK